MIAKNDERIQRVQTIPGVGRKTAEVIVTALDDVDRFDNARQVSAYIGLVPRQYQSGETDRNGRITKRGSRLLRTMLLECAWVSLRYNPWARDDLRSHPRRPEDTQEEGGHRLGPQDRGGRLVDVETRDRLGPERLGIDAERTPKNVHQGTQTRPLEPRNSA